MHEVALPPTAALLALDAFVRYGSVQRAADALGLSQPAMSRRLLALEQAVGSALFDRRTRPMTLTTAGRELHDTLRISLGQIEQVVARLRPSPPSTFTISAGAGFSAYWLIPRLVRMQRAFPTWSLRIVSQSHEQETDDTGDLQVRFGTPPWPGCSSSALFAERVFPVASPMLLAGRPVPATLAQLRCLPLLDLQVLRQPWFDWPAWWSEFGELRLKRSERICFDSYPLVVEAALAGQGVCLCWDGLLDHFLKSGALVRLTAFEASSLRGYHITHAPTADSSAAASRVRDWLLAEAAVRSAGASAQSGQRGTGRL